MTTKKPPLMVSVVGTSGSGKTTTIEYLTSSLTTLGFKVGVAKHIHQEGFTIDTEGKDTWKHAKAGARVVIGASPNELAVIKKTTQEAKFEEIEGVLRAQDLDVALLEGFSTALAGKTKSYKIVAAKNIRDLKYTLSKTRPPILVITGLVTRTSNRIRGASAPLLDIQKEGPLLTSMVRRLLRPGELTSLFNEASLRHRGKCIGLAIGVRAAYVASSVFAHNPSAPNLISCGTKHCIAEAFKTIYPNSQVRMQKTQDDQISLKSRTGKLMIKLASKKKFSGVSEVLRIHDRLLFEFVDFAPR